MTYAEYLAAEAVAEVRHEFLNGEVWAMAGGTPEHGALAVSVTLALGAALKGKPCVLVSQAEPRIEVFRRIEAGRWELLEARPGETIGLQSLGVQLDVAAVYA